MNEQTVVTERPFAKTLDICNSELDASTWTAERVLEAWLAHQLESLRFGAKRVHKDLELTMRMRHCTTWKELLDAQWSWWRDSLADYGEEWGRLLGINIELAMSDVDPLRPLIFRARPAKGAKHQRRTA